MRRIKGIVNSTLLPFSRPFALADKQGMCWISDRNTASQSLYASLGFTKTKHKLVDPEDKEMGTFWIKEIE